MSYEAAFTYKFNQTNIIEAAKRGAPDIPQFNALMGGANGGVCQLISLMWLALSADEQADMASTDMGKNYAKLGSTEIHSSLGAAYWRQVCLNFTTSASVSFATDLGYADKEKVEQLTEQFKLVSKKQNMEFSKVELFAPPKDLNEICSIMRSAWRVNNMGFHSIFGASKGFMCYVSLRFATGEGHGCALRFTSDTDFLFFDPNMGVATEKLSNLEKFIASAGDYYCAKNLKRSPVDYHAFELQTTL